MTNIQQKNMLNKLAGVKKTHNHVLTSRLYTTAAVTTVSLMTKWQI